MFKKVLFIGAVSTMILSAMGGPVPNYDERFNENINDRIKENMESVGFDTTEEEVVEVIKKRQQPSDISNLRLRSLVFQEKNGKNIPVREVKRGDKVVYINLVTNNSANNKRDVIIKNPIPSGTAYVLGSATCSSGCTISYSSNFGEILSPDESNSINYIEYHFKNMDAGQEYRMGFRAIIK